MNRAQRRAARRTDARSARTTRSAAALGSAAALAATGAGAAVVLTGGAAMANPVLTVSTLADGGAGSLREAINDANGTGGQDRIEFSVTGTITLASSLPHITDGVDIVGPGVGSLTVSGGTAYQPFFIDAVTSGSVSIDGLTVTGSSGPGVAAYNTTVPITLSELVITQNIFLKGGGIQAYNNITDITISDVTVSDNFANINGGGLYADATSPGQHITITGSRFEDNETPGAGGGMNVRNSSLTVSDTTFSSNYASLSGGGVFLYAMEYATFDGVTITDNSAGGGGGISAVETPASFSGSTISENYARLGGGIFGIYGTITFNASTVSGNEGSAYGGAAYCVNGSLTFENSTVSSNTSAYVGAISTSGSVTLTSSTVTANTATGAPDAVDGILVLLPAPVWSAELSAAAPGVAARHAAAPLVVPPPATLTVEDSILAGNGDLDVATSDAAALTVPSRSSIFGIVDTPDVTIDDLGGTRTGVTATELALGPLADNGGPTLTHALLPGSVAIDAGGAVAPSFPGNEWDQRGTGYARVENGLVDVGAYEVQVEEPEPTFTG